MDIKTKKSNHKIEQVTDAIEKTIDKKLKIAEDVSNDQEDEI